MRFIVLVALALGCMAAPAPREEGVELAGVSAATTVFPRPAPAAGTCRWTPAPAGSGNTHYVTYHQLPVSGSAAKMCQLVHSDVYRICAATVVCTPGAGFISVSITLIAPTTSKDCGQGVIAAITGTSVPACVE